MDGENYKLIIGSIIKKQMQVMGAEALDRIKGVSDLKVSPDGTVLELGPNFDGIMNDVLACYIIAPVSSKKGDPQAGKDVSAVNKQLASGWYQIQQEKTHLLAAIDAMSLGFVITDESLQIVVQNPALKFVLGESTNKEWTVDEIQNGISGSYFLPLECHKSMESMVSIRHTDVDFKGKLIRIFISPIKILNKDVEIRGVTILFEDLSPTAYA